MKDKKAPKGYKKTEIGIIPEDWEVKRLKDVTEKVIDNRGKTPPYSSKGEIELIETTSISNVRRFPDYKRVEKFVSKYTYMTWFRDHPQKDDLLISTVGEYAGSSAIMFSNRGTIAQNLVGIRIKNSDPVFVFYWTKSNLYRNQLNKVIMNQAQPSLKVPWLLEFRLPIPPLPEQKAIAKVLSDIDKLIESLDKLIEKKKLIKKGAMQELLTGKKRLPGFKGQWVKKKLGEIGTTYGGLIGKKKEDFGTGNSYYIPFLNILMNIKVDTKNLEKVYIKENETQNKVKKGDLFFNTSSETPEEVGTCAVLTEDLENTYLNSFCFGYRLKDKNIDGLFLSYFINSEYGRKIFASIAQGATRYNLSKQYFNNIEILFPPTLEEQQAIARILSDMDAEIEALQKKKEKYEQIKKGVMYLLLTGKVRLKDFKTEEV